jgi:hypothetical protein
MARRTIGRHARHRRPRRSEQRPPQPHCSLRDARMPRSRALLAPTNSRRRSHAHAGSRLRATATSASCSANPAPRSRASALLLCAVHRQPPHLRGLMFDRAAGFRCPVARDHLLSVRADRTRNPMLHSRFRGAPSLCFESSIYKTAWLRPRSATSVSNPSEHQPVDSTSFPFLPVAATRLLCPSPYLDRPSVAPIGTSPVCVICHSAISSLRARATIPTLRPRAVPANRCMYHRLSSLSG